MSVTEGDTAYRPGSEAAGTFTTSREEGESRITWYYPYTSNDTRTFTIAYTVKSGLRLYDGGDQLWWKAVFADRDSVVQSSRVTVHLPPGISPHQLRVAAYGASADYEIVDGTTLVFAARNMAPNRELEVRVQFPHGIVGGQVPR